MLEIDRIQDQLQRVFEGGAWHGPSLMELLQDVPANSAFSRPLPGVHSIWELVLHLTTWKHVVRRRLSGEAVEPAEREDWPPVPPCDEAAWRAALDALKKAQRELEEVISCLTDSSLTMLVAGKDYSIYHMLHGVIQHDLYHAGQIAVIKNAVAGR